jgi:uncharacterized membrane protein
MRFFYSLRTLLISLEALILCVAGFLWSQFRPELDATALMIEINVKILEYLMLLPVAIAVWILNELRQIPFETEATTKILVNWPDYWRLKQHIWVAFFYALLFAGLSIFPWVATTGISTGQGLLIFCTSILGQLTVAASVYSVRFRIKEICAGESPS